MKLFYIFPKKKQIPQIFCRKLYDDKCTSTMADICNAFMKLFEDRCEIFGFQEMVR